MESIKIGSHLITSRVVYTHHGIYAGRGLVIHYSGLSDGRSAGPIEFTTLDSFLNGDSYSIREYSNPKFKGREVVKRARSRVGENKYDLQGNNCEHFCTWAITGRSTSKQVEITEDVADLVIRSPVITTLIKARKHSIQKSEMVEVAKNAADISVKTALVAVTPVALPVIAAYKAIRWLFK